MMIHGSMRYVSDLTKYLIYITAINIFVKFVIKLCYETQSLDHSLHLDIR